MFLSLFVIADPHKEKVSPVFLQCVHILPVPDLGNGCGCTLSRTMDWHEVAGALEDSRRLLESLWAQNAAAVAEGILIPVIPKLMPKHCFHHRLRTVHPVVYILFRRMRNHSIAVIPCLEESVVRMLSGEKITVDTGTFSNDMTTFATKDDVLTLLVHLGYLTYYIQWYTSFSEECVIIP